MKKKFLFLCSIGLALHVAAFCQQLSTTLTAGTAVPAIWAEQWKAKPGPFVLRVPGGMNTNNKAGGKQGQRTDGVDVYMKNTSTAQLYIYLTHIETGTVYFEVFHYPLATYTYWSTIQPGYYDIEIGDYGDDTWKFIEAGCETVKSGYVVTWSNVYLDEGCNNFTVSGGL